ncbi:hypothetical protein [Arthrobacter sp. JSM 101049]|uniref:hypothetical protein n=1 Tax=Arthrobacter sp. JSM 101049 TaxID=929097 RepID=UPI003561618D
MGTLPGPRPVTYSQARVGLKSILDSSAHGGITEISSGDRRAAVVDSARLRDYLRNAVSFPVTVHREDNAYVLLSQGQSFAAEATTIDEAVDLLVDDLVDYAQEWPAHYSSASNHAHNWGLVQLVALSTRDELRAFLVDAAS